MKAHTHKMLILPQNAYINSQKLISFIKLSSGYKVELNINLYYCKKHYLL